MLLSTVREDGGSGPLRFGSPSEARQADEPAVGERVLHRLEGAAPPSGTDRWFGSDPEGTGAGV